MYLGIDCYSPLTRARAEAAKAAGFDFAGRYLIPPEQYANGLSEKEAHVISAAGLGLLCVFETQADRAKGGAKAGEKDGTLAKKCAMRIGMPERGIIYFAVDFGATPEDCRSIIAYLTAAKKAVAPYRAGVYGSCFVMELISALELCAGYWQCVGWSNGLVFPRRSIYQRYWSGSSAARAVAKKIGVSVDINECRSLEQAGIWMYEEDEMSRPPGLWRRQGNTLPACPCRETGTRRGSWRRPSRRESLTGPGPWSRPPGWRRR